MKNRYCFLNKCFLKYTLCNWILEQYKRSLRNQDYLKFFVFKEDNKIVGIVSYSLNNPWNTIICNVDYTTSDEVSKYMRHYVDKNIWDKISS